MKRARCRSCQAPIVWAVTSRRQHIPIDPDPAPGGNIRLYDELPPRAVIVEATIDMFDPDDDGVHWVAHWVTCPDADLWRGAS